jgi:glycerol-3-phosphate dehydrogenase subunit C
MQTLPNENTFANTIRKVLDACADCDTCRFLMDEGCLVFPELYRLYDEEKEHGRVISEHDLQRLSELCTLCGLCPCPDIRTNLIQGKAHRAQAHGMPFHIRMLADVQRLGKLGMLAPKLANRMLSFAPACNMAKNLAGIHPQRRLPLLPDESFFAWARRRGLDKAPDQSPQVAYFAGCSAGYLFPEVAKAAVTVLEKNGISVFVPPQQCCGMPTLLEGDSNTTLRRMAANLKTLLKTIQNGFDIVCSCPTCGFLMKVLLKEGAVYSEAYQRSVGGNSETIKIPDAGKTDGGFSHLKKSMYDKILKDDGLFSGLDPMERIALSEKVKDVGEYLVSLKKDNRSNPSLNELSGRMVYYAPCHQREQGIGSPYLNLLSDIAGVSIEPIGGALDCCGMGGNLGYKKDFYEASIGVAQPLINKIKAAAPEAIVTDCLSCRLQFQHLLPYPVYHPLEILSRAYST